MNTMNEITIVDLENEQKYLKKYQSGYGKSGQKKMVQN